jgi:gephyrin
VLTLAGDSTAGVNPDFYELMDNYCIRISTGAPVPDTADAVVQVEDTELLQKTEDGKEEKKIKILKKPTVGQDIRAIGSDIQENSIVLRKGTRIGPSEMGILAAVGATQFQVYRKPIVALLSTGNELQSPTEPLVKGKIRDSNKTTLDALLREAGFNIVDIGVAKDTPDEVYQKLLHGLSVASVLVSTGGVSMGERDFLKEVLSKDFQAKIHFGSVLMKPGKPTTFATCNFNGIKKFIFSLPGNPVSALVTSHLFLIPACRQLAGFQNPLYNTIQAKIENNFKLDLIRPEFHRVRVFWTPNNPIPVAESTGNQISSRLLSCNSANGLLILPQGTQDDLEAKAGSIMDVLMISFT